MSSPILTGHASRSRERSDTATPNHGIALAVFILDFMQRRPVYSQLTSGHQSVALTADS